MTIFVYAIQAESPSGEVLPIKIGMSNDPARRLNDMRTGTWMEYRLLGSVETSGAITESSIHRALDTDRLRGEWFKPSDQVLRAVAAIASGDTESLNQMIAKSEAAKEASKQESDAVAALRKENANLVVALNEIRESLLIEHGMVVRVTNEYGLVRQRRQRYSVECLSKEERRHVNKLIGEEITNRDKLVDYLESEDGWRDTGAAWITKGATARH